MTKSPKEFTEKEIHNILKKIVNKTLGEIDKNNVFKKTEKHPKITGIAGDVIEESVLEYPSDSRQEADIIVDGIMTEVKTTGLRYKTRKNKVNEIEAKEPMTITAVSPENIVQESFYNSSFWGKLEHMLLIYYLYDSKETVPASEYARFPIKGYELHTFDEEEEKILRKDWEIVHNFIKDIQEKYDVPEDEYPRISSELRPQLMMIDTAPKWPHRPRFRLKRATVTSIVQQYFGRKLEKLGDSITSYVELEKKLRHFTDLYKGKSVQELINIFEIQVKLTMNKDVPKNVSEQIVTAMFGAESKKISNIKLFNRIGLISKTITVTKEGYRTEDTKLSAIDFSEWKDENKQFEDSSIYEYFSQNQFLFIIFEEHSKGAKLLENTFLGFKRIAFSDDFIYAEVKRTWEDTRFLLLNNKLKETIVEYKTGPNKGKAIINKNGKVRKSINFPKSRDYHVFIRGTGQDSSYKPEKVNGIKMYKQDFWLKGSWIANELKKIDFI